MPDTTDTDKTLWDYIKMIFKVIKWFLNILLWILVLGLIGAQNDTEKFLQDTYYPKKVDLGLSWSGIDGFFGGLSDIVFSVGMFIFLLILVVIGVIIAWRSDRKKMQRAAAALNHPQPTP